MCTPSSTATIGPVGAIDLEIAYKSTAPGGDLIVNTLSAHLTWGDELDAPDHGEIINAVSDWLTDTYCGMLADDYSVNELVVRQLGIEDPWVRSLDLSRTGDLG